MFPEKGVPLNSEAAIYWNEYQIPYIHAQHDDDLPLLLGMVHAHLRLGQMELLRHVSQGRLAELFGPLLVDVDYSLRIVDFGKSVPAILQQLPSETRRWLERYAEGINFYKSNTATLPDELEVLGIKNTTPWSSADVLTLGRLAGTDVNWLYWFFNMKLKQEEAWPEIWERLIAYGQTSHPSFNPPNGSALHVFETMIRSGSNAAAIGGAKSTSGSALMAGDPHLGLMLPNFWVIVGCKSPSFHMVGLTMPGLPAVLVGRNESIAWGGTNMLALSSIFYDISAPNYDAPATRKEKIVVRWWFDKKVIIRESPLGPVISDAPLLDDALIPRLALKWRGHQTSHEITAFLRVNQAQNWNDFVEAFDSYAVSGQNMLYADKHGNIGQVAAVSYSPAAGRANTAFFADPSVEEHQWSRSLSNKDLPFVYNPEQRYLVSTNNIPVRSDPPLALFGNSNDRYHDLSETIQSRERISLFDLMEMQRSVYSRTSHQLAKLLAEKGKIKGSDPQIVDILQSWDGNYDSDSQGAAAFEIVTYYLASRYYSARYGEVITRYLLRSPAIYAFLLDDLKRPECQNFLFSAFDAATEDLSDTMTWGDLHVLELRHPLGNIPLIGRKYRFGEYQVAGSTNTVMKRAHSITNKKRPVTYGANARHISDLADPDENYFSLVGGQDGFWGSENYLDLYHLWRDDKYVRLPLTLASVQKQFTHHMLLQPQIVK